MSRSSAGKHRQVKGNIALDFDGVLHELPGYHWPPAGLDFSLIRQAHARGYAVTVMTCNDVYRVAELLEDHGFSVEPDEAMHRMYWSDPEVVLVTGRKVCATAYVDDKAIRYQYGDDTGVLWADLDSRGKVSV